MGNLPTSDLETVTATIEPAVHKIKAKFGILHQTQCQPFQNTTSFNSLLPKTNLTEFAYNSPLLPSSLELEEQVLAISKSANFEELKERYGRPDYYANVVSFVGDTHSGKSTIISELLDRLSSASTVACKPTVAKQSMTPTTGNTNLYVASTILEATTSATGATKQTQTKDDAQKMGQLFIVDYEGSNGSSKLPVDVAEELERYPNNDHVLDTALRRRSANEHFPRLALLTSDVIVVMTELDLTNSKNLEQISEVILQQALHGVDSYEKPFLIIVKNKSSNENPSHFETLTREFKDAHQDKVAMLSKYYAGLSVVEIPTWYVPNGRELFQKKMDELYTLIKQLVNTRYHLKTQSGSLISQKSWFILLQILLEDSNTDVTLNFPKLLNEVLKISSNKVLENTYNFYSAYASVLGKSEQFETLRDLTTNYLLLQAIDSYLSNEIDSTVLFAEERERKFQHQVSELLEQLYAYTLTFEPCASKKGEYVCKEVRCTHSNNHFVNPKNADSWTVLKQNFKNIFSQNAKLNTWTGGFEPSSRMTEVEFVDAGLRRLQKLYDEMKSSENHYALLIPLKMYNLVKGLAEIRMESVVHSSNKLCTLCFKNSAESFAMCKHLLFCNECKTYLYQAEDAGQCEVKCALCR